MKIGTIKGIEIKIHFSTLLIVGLVGFYAASFFLSLVSNASFIEIILVGIINGLIILASILIHELCHSLMAQKYGLKVKEIELYLFGGVSKIEEEPVTPKSELVISGVGPLSSIILGMLFLVAFTITDTVLPAWIYVTLLYSGISNIGLGIFNLLPAFPMDGGRVLRAYLWNKRNNIISATKTASRVGVFIGYSLIVYGFFQIFFLGSFAGIWMILIGSFLNTSARKSYIQTVNEITLSHLNVRNIMGAMNLKDMIDVYKLEIPFDMTVNEAIKNYFIPYKKTYFPVVRGNSNDITGIIHLDDIKKIPNEQRSNMIIGYLERPLSMFPTLYIEETGKDVLKRIVEMKTFPHVVIVRERTDDKIIGFISEQDLYLALKFCELHPELC